MSKEENVIKYYVLCNKLKNVIRTGWLVWNIERERVESVAEHIFSVQMVAIAMNSEYNYDINLEKVILMLAVHELEEIVIGDIPMTSKEHANKQERGHQAIKEVLSSLTDKEAIESLILEFDERKTEEAKFAYHCDKLECDLQAKLYDEEGCFHLDNQKGNAEYQERTKNGEKTFTECWYETDESLFVGDENFQKVFQYARYHQIGEK